MMVIWRWVAAGALLFAGVAGCSGGGGDSDNECARTAVNVNTKCQTANDCPGAGKPNAKVECVEALCTFECRGEAYDVDGNTSNGCEYVDPTQDHHYEDSGFNLGEDSCLDSSSREEFTGVIVSDARQHRDPSIHGLDGDVGAAPDWYKIKANGGLCENDVDFQIQVRTAAHPDRYLLTVRTDRDTFQCRTDANGWCRVHDGSGSYSDESWVRIGINKVDDHDILSCMPDVAEYRVIGHL